MEASSKKEPLALLSRNNAKTLMVRNAINQATLQKEAQLLQKERNSGERLFLKKKKHILQRYSRIISEMGHQRPLSSCSLPVEDTITRWNSEKDLAGVLSPKPRRKKIDGNNKSRLSYSSYITLHNKFDFFCFWFELASRNLLHWPPFSISFNNSSILNETTSVTDFCDLIPPFSR